MLNNTERYSVLNYNENAVSVAVSPDKHYVFEPSPDGVTPINIPMTMDEIRYVNNSSAFKSGLLFFDHEHEAELYEALNIPNWENILKNEDIRDIILHPTYEGLEKIININKTSDFERVRTVFHKIKRDETDDISIRVVQIIETRYKELLAKKINSSIVLKKNEMLGSVQSDEVNKLKEQNDLLQKQMAEMKAMLEAMANQKNNVSNTQTESEKETEQPKKKKPGRPPKTS